MLNALIALAALATPQAGENLIVNGDFTSEEGWTRRVHEGTSTHALADQGFDLTPSVVIRAPREGSASYFQKVKVEPYSTYRLSAMVGTNNLVSLGGKGAFIGVTEFPEDGSRALSGTVVWTRLESVFRTRGYTEVTVELTGGGWGTVRGDAYFDKVQLVKVEEDVPSATATIQTGKTREPINPFIYGQFIEHLGRCIYGGIWAEMLEDRKFSFPVTSNFAPYRPEDKSEFPILVGSPWQIVGLPTGVRHRISTVVPRRPLIELISGSAVEQARLGVVNGKDYTGRLRSETSSIAEVTLTTEAGSVSTRVDLASGTGTFRLKAKGDSQNAKFTIKNVGQTPLHLFAASLMPADNIDGFRADTIKLLKELNAPIYRWPGGNFVSGYEWRDGLGDPDLRPTRRNPAWTGIETNDVGTHEFLKFCEILGTEPMVVVNTGFGDPYSAGQWVEYLNGAYETPMGQLRFKNGRREPWKVKWWGVGNEMFGNWQLGYMALEQYTLKHNETVDRMRAVDPAVKLVGVGAVGRWSQVMLGRCADSMDQISEHTYIFNDMPDVPGYVRKLPSSIATIAKAHRQYRATIPALKGKDIKINLDEWNYWHGPQVFGELGVRYRMKDGLGVAAGLHEIIRNSDLFGMAMYAQTVNVIGAIKTDRTQAAMETTGLVLALYRKEFGSIPVDVTGTMMQVDMDTVAAWTADRKALTVAIVNPYREPMNVSLKLDGGSFAPEAKHWVIASPDAMDHNDPKDPEKIKIVQRSLNFTGSLELAGYSVNLLRFEAR